MAKSSSGQGEGSYLVDVPHIIDSVGRLFETLWNRSPILAYFCVVMVILLPFYWVYTKHKLVPTEKAADKRVRSARAAHKSRTSPEKEAKK